MSGPASVFRHRRDPHGDLADATATLLSVARESAVSPPQPNLREGPNKAPPLRVCQLTQGRAPKKETLQVAFRLAWPVIISPRPEPLQVPCPVLWNSSLSLPDQQPEQSRAGRPRRCPPPSTVFLDAGRIAPHRQDPRLPHSTSSMPFIAASSFISRRRSSSQLPNRPTADRAAHTP